MKKNLFSLLIIGILIAFENSCDLVGSDTPPPSAAFKIVHASSDAPHIDVFANGNIITENFAYGRDTGYFSIFPGAYNLKIAPTGTFNYLIDDNISFSPAKYYSLFVIDYLSKINLTALEDNYSIPASDSAQVRLLDFSLNAPTLNVQLYNTTDTTDTLKYSGRYFNDQNNNAALAAFKTIKAGTYTLQFSTSSDSTFVDSISDIILSGSKIYTLYLKGYYSGSGVHAIDTGIVRHN